MNPEERELLERLAKMAEENNRMLRNVHSIVRWGQFWGFIKIAIIVIPLIIGYFYLQPYLGPIGRSFEQMKVLFGI